MADDGLHLYGYEGKQDKAVPLADAVSAGLDVVPVTAGGATGTVAQLIGTKAPAVVAPELSPYQYGATGGDPVADQFGLSAVFSAAVAQKRPVILNGTFALQAPPESTFTKGNRSGTDYAAHVCVRLLSGLQVYGRDATIVVKPPTFTLGANERVILFGTNRNMVAGTLKDIRFEDVTFDFRNEFGTVHTFTYAMGAIGVDRLERRNLRIVSTGTRAGRGFWGENLRYRRDEGLRYRNITQGSYTYFDDDYRAHDIEFDGFVEGLDFDAVARRPYLTKHKFMNGIGESQCIDWSGIVGGIIDGLQADKVSTLVYIYDKPVNFPTYAEFIASQDGTNPDPALAVANPATSIVSSNCRVTNVTATNMTSTNEDVIRVSNYREENTTSAHDLWYRDCRLIHDISFASLDLQGGTRVIVNEGLGITFRDVTLRDFKPGTDSEDGAALAMRQSFHSPTATANSGLSGAVNGLYVYNCQGGVLAINGPGDMKVGDIWADGYNLQANGATSRGLRIERMGTKPGRTELGSCTLLGPPAANNDLLINGTVGSPPNFSFAVTGPLNLRTVPTSGNNLDVRVGGAMRPDFVKLDPANTTRASAGAATVIVRQPVRRASNGYARIVKASILVNTAVAGDATNYSRIYFQRSRAGTLQNISGSVISYDNVARTADTEIPMPIVDNTAGTLLEPGDTLLVTMDTGGGLGSIVSGVALLLVTVPYVKV